MQIAQKRHIASIDGMRFLMCLGIAALHLTFYFFDNDGLAKAIVEKFDYFVEIFFIVSGYCLAISPRNHDLWSMHRYTTFVWARFVRLYPVYFASVAFYLVIGVLAYAGILHPDNMQRYDLSNALPHLLLVQSWGWGDSLSLNYVAWAVSVLWFMYLCFPLCIKLRDKSAHLMLFLILIMCPVLDQFSFEWCELKLSLIQQCDLGLLRGIPSFLFGVWLSNTGKAPFLNRFTVLAGLLISLAYLIVHPLIHDYTRLFVVFGFMYFFMHADQLKIPSPLSWHGFKPLAKYSYCIYLLHPIIATVFLAFLMPKVLGTEDLMVYTHGAGWAFVGVIASLLLSFGLAVAAYHILEAPAAKLLSKKSDAR
jgi:peptidoglycan/LPS O-acetylase OafA/YrhL